MAKFKLNIEKGRQRISAKLPPGHTLETIATVDFTDPKIAEQIQKDTENLKSEIENHLRPTDYELSQIQL